MGGQPLLLAGNSIGGGLSAGAAATLGPLCKGLVLCNTAGVLEEPATYQEPAVSVRDATLAGGSYAGKPYSPVPLLGQPALDLFGEAVIRAIYPSIPPERFQELLAASRRIALPPSLGNSPYRLHSRAGAKGSSEGSIISCC